jgi:uncharacterized glyoxalase superfamily protein PhnB
MPEETFESRLRTDLERRMSMSVSASETKTPAIREGFQAVTPTIITPDGENLIQFLKRTFGAEEVLRAPTPGGFHAEVRIGDSMLMIGTGDAVRAGQRVGAFHIYVPDCDAAFARALAAGAASMGEPVDRPYGERSGFAKDSTGNLWYIGTRLANHYAPEGVGTVVPYLHPPKVRAFIEFAERAFGAERMEIHEDPAGRVMHAAVRIGGAVVEMGEPQDESQNLPSMFVLYVEDCEAAYRRAVAAGAISLREPADRPKGHRTAVVEDPFGYRWIPSSVVKNAAS